MNPAPARDPAERLTFTVVIGVLIAVPLLTFLFSFGNVWDLARRLDVPTYVQPLVAPAVDLSVAGLFVALAYLSLRGIADDTLRPARHLLHLSGVATLALNCAGAVVDGKFGRAAFDGVGPMLLIGWGAVGPILLRLVMLARTLPMIRSVPDGNTDPATPVPADGMAVPAPAAPRTTDDPIGAPATTPPPVEQDPTGSPTGESTPTPTGSTGSGTDWDAELARIDLAGGPVEPALNVDPPADSTTEADQHAHGDESTPTSGGVALADRPTPVDPAPARPAARRGAPIDPQARRKLTPAQALTAARRIARKNGKPVTGEQLRIALGVGAKTARDLRDRVNAEIYPDAAS